MTLLRAKAFQDSSRNSSCRHMPPQASDRDSSAGMSGVDMPVLIVYVHAREWEFLPKCQTENAIKFGDGMGWAGLG